MGPTLPLVTDRLLIEPMRPDDAPALAAYRSDAEVARYQSWTTPFTIEQAEALLAANPSGWHPPGEWAQLAIRVRGVLVGDVAVHPLDDQAQPGAVEIGMTLAPAAQGRGIATEAVGALVDACFAAGIHRVLAACDARNAPVARLLARLRFRHEGRFVDAERWHGEWTTIDVWAALATDRAG